MKIALAKAWQFYHEVDIQEISERVFVFAFESVIEKGKVLFRQPWSFNKALGFHRD